MENYLKAEDAKKMANTPAIIKEQPSTAEIVTRIFNEIINKSFNKAGDQFYLEGSLPGDPYNKDCDNIFSYTHELTPYQWAYEQPSIDTEKYASEICNRLNALGYITTYIPSEVNCSRNRSQQRSVVLRLLNYIGNIFLRPNTSPVGKGKIIVSWDVDLSASEEESVKIESSAFNDTSGSVIQTSCHKTFIFNYGEADAKKMKKYTNLIKKDGNMAFEREVSTIMARACGDIFYESKHHKRYSTTFRLYHWAEKFVVNPNQPDKWRAIRVNEEKYASEICKRLNNLGYKTRYLPERLFRFDNKIVITWER